MITLVITMILAVATIVGAVGWNRKRFSLWRISVAALGVLYSVFAVLFFVRHAGYLSVRDEVVDGYCGINYAIDMAVKLMPFLSADVVRISIHSAIVVVDILVATVSVGLGFCSFPKLRPTRGKFIAMAIVVIVSLPLLFPLCCLIMSAGGYAFNLTYKEFCVIGNNYGQAAVLVWSALAVVICVIRYRIVADFRRAKEWLLLLMSVAYFCCYVWAFSFMWNHYAMPLDQAFDLTVKELIAAGQFTGLGYEGVNLAIYVFGFAAVVAFNCLLASKLKTNRD